jgi:hypothetical protein
MNTPSFFYSVFDILRSKVSRSVGKYLASHPSWLRKQRSQWNRRYPSENHVIADSSFRPETSLQPFSAALTNSQTATIQEKLDELRILAAKFSFPEDARKILEWANIRLRQGNEEFLNNKLDQLRMLNRQGGTPF